MLKERCVFGSVLSLRSHFHQAFADEHDIDYIEVSAKSGENVEEVREHAAVLLASSSAGICQVNKDCI